jgi:CHAT domain-containing protein/tetratricopeptide (TPR) repeat protein
MEMGSYLWLTGDYAAGKQRLERALAINESAFGPNHPRTATVEVNLGGVLSMMGDLPAARRVLEQAIASYEQSVGLSHPDASAAMTNLSSVLMDLGDFDAARVLCRRTLQEAEEKLGPNHILVAMALTNLGLLERRTGHPGTAKPLFIRGLAIRENALGREAYDVSLSLEGLADAYRDLGDLDSARVTCARGLSIRQKELGDQNPETAREMSHLASILADGGDLESAEALFDRAARIQEATLGPAHPDLASSLASRAEVLLRMGREDPAFETALRVEEIAGDHLRWMARRMPESDALRYEAVRASGLGVLLAVTVDDPAPARVRRAWSAAIRTRALVLDEMASRHRALVLDEDPGIAELEQRLTAATTRLANLVVQEAGFLPSEAFLGLLSAAGKEKKEAEDALAERSAAFRMEIHATHVDLAGLESALHAGEALVGIYRYSRAKTAAGPFYVAFVQNGPGRDPAVVDLGPAAALDSLVSRWNRMVARSTSAAGVSEAALEADTRVAGAALRSALWAPLESDLAGAARVFFVPDGAANLVNLAALPDGDRSYLLETGPTVHYLSSERDLLTPVEEASDGAGLLALGGPDFDDSGTAPPPQSGFPAPAEVLFRGGHSGCREFANLVFEPLPGSAREAKEIGALWKRATKQATKQGTPRAGAPRKNDLVLLAGAATESAFKQLAPGRRVLHLATHGFLLGADCAPAGPAGLSPAGVASGPVLSGDEPLLRCGLALAGANRRDVSDPNGEDGILTAEEIASLDLSGVEWAVLSGCETGAGDVLAGEGVLGLRRAFQVAGVRTLVMSLWKVDDEATRTWMRELYRARLDQGLSTSDAVREASLAVLRELRKNGEATHPFLWGAFVAAGDWR